MTNVIRWNYLNKIAPFVDKPIIKILTGMRRVGKSTILRQIAEELLKDIPAKNIYFFNFEALEHLHIRDSLAFRDLIRERVKFNSDKVYLFFDEIQNIKNWEEVVNGMQVQFDCDIYLTGSNSSMLSGDLATLLAGRYVNFEIQAFTFSEFVELYRSIAVKAGSPSDLSTELRSDDLFLKFIKLGGMPALKYFNFEEEASHKYLTDVYNTVLVKDVLAYRQIRDVDLFNRILLFVMDNIGQTFSANSIRKFLKSEGRIVSPETVLNYLDFCQEAFLIKKASRYDTVGKKILKVDEKYYLSDHGFREAKGFSNTRDIEKILENIVFMELKSRGYEVRIGKVEHREIDFIALKEGKIEYYQVSYLLAAEETIAREFGIYEELKDNYPKYVLSMDKFDFSQNGIVHKNIIDFLLEA